MVPPAQRDYAYQRAVELLQAFLTELAGCHPPVLSPLMHEHFVGQLSEIWSRATLLYNELVPEQPFVDVTAPSFVLLESPEPFHELAQIATTLSEQFGHVTTNLYSTESPTDEQIIMERCTAIQELLDSVIYGIDGAEESSNSPMYASW